MLTALRWLFTPVVGIVGAEMGIAIAVALYQLLWYACPSEMLISGMCTAAWFANAVHGVFAVGACAGAPCAVSFPFFLAPSRQRVVGVVALAAGAAYAIFFAVSVGDATVVYTVLAIAAGSFTLRMCWNVGEDMGLTPPSSGQAQASLDPAAHVER